MIVSSATCYLDTYGNVFVGNFVLFWMLWLSYSTFFNLVFLVFYVVF